MQVTFYSTLSKERKWRLNNYFQERPNHFLERSQLYTNLHPLAGKMKNNISKVVVVVVVASETCINLTFNTITESQTGSKQVDKKTITNIHEIKSKIKISEKN